jgi:hypothetical protein
MKLSFSPFLFPRFSKVRVIAISIENGGQKLVLEREVRSCFEPGQGLSGIPMGGGCGIRDDTKKCRVV